MPVAVNTGGAMTVTGAQSGLSGRYFRRREPQGDPGDLVICQGVIDVGGYAGACAELVVTSATFGAVPEGWDGPTISYDLEAFAEEYAETNGAERAAHALEQAGACKAATAKAAKRDSPWRRA